MSTISAKELSDVLKNDKKLFNDASTFKGIILDLFFECEPWFINILCTVLSCNIVDEMWEREIVDEFVKHRWVNSLSYRYGFDRERIILVLTTWLEAIDLVKKYDARPRENEKNKTIIIDSLRVWDLENTPKKEYLNGDLKSLTVERDNFCNNLKLNCKNLNNLKAPAYTAKTIMQKSILGQRIQLTISYGFIGDKYFADLEKLDRLFIEDVQYIGRRAFENCVNLQKVDIDARILSIETCTFKGCVNLKEVVLPDSLFTIRYGAFEGCTKLKRITLPESISNIEAGAFETGYCNAEIVFKGTKAQWNRRQFQFPPNFRVVHCTNGDIIIHS